MVGVITAVLAGAEAGIAVLAGFDAPAVAMAVGGLVALGALSGMLYQRRTWARAAAAPITEVDATTT